MKRFITLFAAIVLAMSSLFGQQMQNLPNDPAVRKGQLENGLTYYIRHNEKPAGRAEFYLATNVGAIQETPDQDGLAHFLEHMCFNGTKNFPDKKLLDYLQSIGASFGGNVNASTGVEQTIYMLTNIPLVNDEVVDNCILIMHDYSHFVVNDPAEIDKERGVIIEERRQRRDASWRLHERSLPYYYGDTKYGTCTLIGSQENLETFKPESLVNFYQTWYHPDMQALIVVGDVDVDEVEKKIERIFSDIPKAENPKPKDVIMIPGNEKPVVGVLTDPEQTSSMIEVLWKSDAAPEEYNSTVIGKVNDLMKTIISAVMSERFNDITSDPSAPYLSGALQVGNLCETMDVVMGQVNFREGEAIPAFTAFLTEIEKMKRFGFTEDELERAKTNILAMYENAANSADTRQNAELVGELIYNFFDNQTYMEPKAEYEVMQQLMPMLTADAINQVLPQLITDENMVVLFKGPEKEGLVSPTEDQLLAVVNAVKSADIQANVAEALDTDLLDPSQLKGSKVKKTEKGMYGSTVWYLKNGLKVVLLPTDYQKDEILFNIIKDGGESLIPTADLNSFESNIYTLFQQNTGISKFPATTLSKMLAGKNITASPYIDGLHHGISGSSVVKDLETAFQLAYLEFVDPRFDQSEYDKGIKTLEAILPNYMNQPNYQLSKQLNKVLYGDNPRVVTISPEVMQKANLQTIEKNYRAMFNDAKGAVLTIVGDFTPAGIQPLVEKYFGSLPKGKKALKWVDTHEDILPGNRTNDFNVDMQTPMTSVVDVFSAPVKWSQDKSAALAAAQYILNMRYVTSLREDEGGTYGASVAMQMARQPKEEAIIQIYYNCRPSSADKLRELAMRDLNNLASEGPTAEEFDMAQKNLQKNIPESRIRNSYWLSTLQSYETYGQESVDAYEKAVNGLKASDVSAIVKEILAAGNHAELVMRPGNTAEAE